ncbi:MAG: hypothetical protein QG639_916 [Patescibacteria group bacterium]|nr:hypothetical protein [Patescibacteria group bacterium]
MPNNTVIAAFSSVNEAENAINILKDEGYDPKQMTIMMKDKQEVEQVADDTGANVAAGTVEGAATGGMLGGLAGLLVGVGAITLPGIGPFLAAGPLVTALGLTGTAATTVTGAATGAVAGGLIGALMGLGLSEEEAAVYETTIKEGGIVVAVPTLDKGQGHITEILDNNGATQVRVLSA